MSPLEPKGTLTLGKGSVLKMYEDTSQALESGGRFYTEVEYDGEESSWVPVVGNHWHKYHDEWIEVLSGRVSVYLNGKWSTRTPESGPLFVPRRLAHGFRFFKGERTVARERTEPSGEFKHFFFQDAFPGDQFNFWQAMGAFDDGDTYVALPLGVGFLDEAFTRIAGSIGRLLYPRATGLGSGKPPPE